MMCSSVWNLFPSQRPQNTAMDLARHSQHHNTANRQHFTAMTLHFQSFESSPTILTNLKLFDKINTMFNDPRTHSMFDLDLLTESCLQIQLNRLDHFFNGPHECSKTSWNLFSTSSNKFTNAGSWSLRITTRPRCPSRSKSWTSCFDTHSMSAPLTGTTCAARRRVS